MKLKITLITQEYLPPLVSGNGVYAQILANSLKDHELLIICSGQSTGKVSGSNVFTVASSLETSMDSLGFMADALENIGEISKFEPDIVIGVDWQPAPLCSALSMLIGCKFIWMPFRIYSYLNEYLANEGLFKRIKKLEEFASKNSDAIITVSEVDSKLIKRLFGCASHPIFPPLNRKIKEYIDSHELPTVKEDYILIVSRISPEKEIDRVINAMPQIDSRLKLLIAGHISDKNYEKSLNRKLRYLGVEERVILLGRVPIDRLIDLYSKATAYMCPSKYEPFGLNIIEAAAFSLPIIIDNSGLVGAGELFKQNESCFFVDLSNTEEVAQAIDTIVNDQGSAQKVGETARKIALGLNEEEFAKNMNKFIYGIAK